jgi:hypothetical protein
MNEKLGEKKDCMYVKKNQLSERRQKYVCQPKLNRSQCSRRRSTLRSAKFLAIALKRLILHLLSNLFVPLAMRLAINLANSA